MGFLRAIANEVGLTFRLTFLPEKPVDWRWLRGAHTRLGWFADRHLRNGFLLAAPIFIGGMALIRPRPGFEAASAFGFAFLCNLLWFVFAALSRRKERA